MALACIGIPPSPAAGLAGVLSSNLLVTPPAVSETVVYAAGVVAATSHGVVSHYRSGVENEGTRGRTLLVEPDPKLGETGMMRLVEDLSPLLQLQLILTPVG